MNPLLSKTPHTRLSRTLVFSLALWSHLSGASQEAEVLKLPESEQTAALRATALPELGDSRLERILHRYYEKSVGGTETWNGLTSIIATGQMEQDDGVIMFKTLKKKPNLLKISLQRGSSEITLAYDGSTAWEELTGSAGPRVMDAERARSFVMNASFGSHLLFPYAEGKKIELIDTVPVEGSICHQIRVTLDAGFQIDYFIDVREFVEVKNVTTDLREGGTRTAVFHAYNREFGVPIPTKIDFYKDGEWERSQKVEEIRVNTGVMPWMFHRPE